MQEFSAYGKEKLHYKHEMVNVVLESNHYHSVTYDTRLYIIGKAHICWI